MKKLILIGSIIILSLTLFPQEIFIAQSLVVNIEVPVRVFKKGEFIENLILEDFELFEDGVPQREDGLFARLIVLKGGDVLVTFSMS